MIFFVISVIAFLYTLFKFYVDVTIEHEKNNKPGEEVDKTKYEIELIRMPRLWHVLIVFAIITLLHRIFL